MKIERESVAFNHNFLPFLLFPAPFLQLIAEAPFDRTLTSSPIRINKRQDYRLTQFLSFRTSYYGSKTEHVKSLSS